MRLYLIRHAAVTVRPDRPGPQWHLSPEGRAAAETLAEEPYWADLRLMYTSTEPKAVGTAQRISSRHNLPVRTEPDLREVRGRDWVGEESYRELAKRYLAGDGVDGWEPKEAALQRVRSCISGIVDESGGEDVGLVSHGLILTIYLADLLGLDARTSCDLWSGLRFPDVAVVDPKAKRMEREFGQQRPRYKA